MRTQVSTDYQPEEEEPFKAEITVSGLDDRQRKIVAHQLDVSLSTAEVLQGKESVEVTADNREDAEEAVTNQEKALKRLFRKIKLLQKEGKEWESKFKEEAE